MTPDQIVRETADMVLDQAIANFKEAGELAPVVMMRGGNRDAIAMLKLEGNTPKVIGMVLASLGALLESKMAIFVSETWSKSMREEQVEDGVRLAHRRGDLEKMHQMGDASVHTSLLVSVWDFTDLDNSLTVMVDTDDDYRRTDMPGVGEGAVSDMVRATVRILPTLIESKPPEAGIKDITDILVDCVSGIAFEMEPGEEPPMGGVPWFGPHLN
jgi:hypothetical protein